MTVKVCTVESAGASATPWMLYVHVKLGFDTEMATVAECLVMDGGQKEKGICVVASGPICSFAFLFSREKTPLSLLDSRTTSACTGSRNGFLKLMVCETGWCTCAATVTLRDSSGERPVPVALYTHWPTTGCSKMIWASSTTPRLEGLYSICTVVGSSGGRTTFCCTTLKLILFVDLCLSTTSCPVGLSIVTDRTPVCPSSTFRVSNSSGGAASARRSRSYQNSPTTSLKNTAEPFRLAGSSGLKTSS